MSKSPVRIIGAGIGGLTLCRCLLKHGVPAILYERVPSKPRHPYGITLHASSYRPLLDILGLDESNFRRRVGVDGSNGKIDPSRVIRDVPPTSFRAQRAKLEQLLREGVDVRWLHPLEKVEESPTGIKLHFEGANTETASCIIGVDGPHSVTRKSLLPDTPLNVLPFVAFNGKRRVKKEVFESIYASAFKDTNLLEIKLKDTIFSISVDESVPDLVSISWIYSRPAKGSSDMLFKPNRSTSSATEIPLEFYTEIKTHQDLLPQPFKEVFNAETLKTERALNWLMRTILVKPEQLKDLVTKGVYLMGDSVHAEPILGGDGANRAIQDGIGLAQCIAENGPEGISAWYDAVYPTWEAGVKESEDRIADMHSIQPSAAL